MDSGILEKLYQHYFSTDYEWDGRDLTRHTVVLINIQSIFIFLIVSYAVAIVCVFVEYYFYNVSKPPTKNLPRRFIMRTNINK